MSSKSKLKLPKQIGDYPLMKFISSRAKAAVFKCHDNMAIKVAESSKARNQLKAEYCNFKKLPQNSPHFPSVMDYKHSIKAIKREFSIMTMQLYKSHNVRSNKKKFVNNIRDCACLFVSILDALETIHKTGNIHCNIKPSQISEPLKELFFANYWLYDMGQMQKDRKPYQKTGKCQYKSINAHLCLTLTRADDVEQLMYTIMSCYQDNNVIWRQKSLENPQNKEYITLNYKQDFKKSLLNIIKISKNQDFEHFKPWFPLFKIIYLSQNLAKPPYSILRNECRRLINIHKPFPKTNYDFTITTANFTHKVLFAHYPQLFKIFNNEVSEMQEIFKNIQICHLEILDQLEFFAKSQSNLLTFTQYKLCEKKILRQIIEWMTKFNVENLSQLIYSFYNPIIHLDNIYKMRNLTQNSAESSDENSDENSDGSSDQFNVHNASGLTTVRKPNSTNPYNTRSRKKFNNNRSRTFLILDTDEDEDEQENVSDMMADFEDEDEENMFEDEDDNISEIIEDNIPEIIEKTESINQEKTEETDFDRYHNMVRDMEQIKQTYLQWLDVNKDVSGFPKMGKYVNYAFLKKFRYEFNNTNKKTICINNEQYYERYYNYAKIITDSFKWNINMNLLESPLSTLLFVFGFVPLKPEKRQMTQSKNYLTIYNWSEEILFYVGKKHKQYLINIANKLSVIRSNNELDTTTTGDSVCVINDKYITIRFNDLIDKDLRIMHCAKIGKNHSIIKQYNAGLASYKRRLRLGDFGMLKVLPNSKINGCLHTDKQTPVFQRMYLFTFNIYTIYHFQYLLGQTINAQTGVTLFYALSDQASLIFYSFSHFPLNWANLLMKRLGSGSTLNYCEGVKILVKKDECFACLGNTYHTLSGNPSNTPILLLWWQFDVVETNIEIDPIVLGDPLLPLADLDLYTKNLQFINTLDEFKTWNNSQYSYSLLKDLIPKDIISFRKCKKLV